MCLSIKPQVVFHLAVVKDDQRAEVCAFTRHCFAKHYAAEVSVFMPQLLSLRDQQGCLVGALGLRLADAERLFSEQYLPAPVEQMISQVCLLDVPRGQIVEVGQLAAADAGSARTLIIHTTAYLARAGLHHVVFTGTRQLRNSFARLGLRPFLLARAEAAHLGLQAQQWGRYYDTGPCVMAGDIALGDLQLQARGVYAAYGVHEPLGAACA